MIVLTAMYMKPSSSAERVHQNNRLLNTVGAEMAGEVP